MFYSQSKVPLWFYLLVLLSAVLPVFVLGWYLLKSSEDSLIAQKVYAADQARELLSLHAEKVEERIQVANSQFDELATGSEWYKKLRADPRIGGIRWIGDKQVELTLRDQEVSRWLLDPTTNQELLVNWLETSRNKFSPAFILFVLQESGLEVRFPLMIDQLGWELNPDDLRGVQLQNNISILWDRTALPKLESGYKWSNGQGSIEVLGLGEFIGVAADSTPIQPKRNSSRVLLAAVCLGWVSTLSLILLGYARKREREAHETLDRLSVVAHELRTPLTGIKLLIERVKTQYPRILHLDQMELERQRLEDVMEKFLVQGKLRKEALQFHSVAWSEWLREEYSRYLSLSKGCHRLSFEQSSMRDKGAYIDPSMMSIVLSNLMKNALQYGGGSKVTIRELSDHKSIGFEVSDEGLGIPEELHQKVFEKYERGEQTLNRHDEGLGLGLSLAKEIVEGHGGQIVLQSEQGKGTRVQVILPAY